MVAQEWPTCWDSQKVQPFEALEETARLHTVRLRNHPSLVQWAGGNESAAADGAAMDMFGASPMNSTAPGRFTARRPMAARCTVTIPTGIWRRWTPH